MGPVLFDAIGTGSALDFTIKPVFLYLLNPIESTPRIATTTTRAAAPPTAAAATGETRDAARGAAQELATPDATRGEAPDAAVVGMGHLIENGKKILASIVLQKCE